MPTKPNELSPTARKRLKLAGLIAAGAAGLIVVSGITTRLYADKEAETFSSQQAIQTVGVVTPSFENGSGTLDLPGKLEAFDSAPIYARVPGYVHAWYKDIGARVHKGDVLALIDTPELDQQIDQAKADLASAIAAKKLSQTTAERWNSLLALDAVSKQESEEKAGDLAAKTALANAASAEVDRLEALKTFARITAPFDGIVTNRSVDIGTLVNAGAQSTGAALFTVADEHQVRAYVSVPQTYSAQIKPGLTATMTVPEYPGRTFTATLDSTSDAISEQSDTLLVEFLADNPDGTLKPGEYAQVTLHLPHGGNILRLPASALIFRQAGLQVAAVLPNDHVEMKPITLARDLGPVVEVSGGLGPHDRIIDNPPDSIESGDKVHVKSSTAS